MSWFVYIVRCSDDTLYTGITTDIERRVKQHNAGKGAKYTSSRNPVELVCKISVADRSIASKIEHSVKKAHKSKKCELLLSLG